mgnify:CR=1 FL=1
MTPKSLSQIIQKDFEDMVFLLLQIDTGKYEKAARKGISKILRDEMVTVVELKNYNDSRLVEKYHFLMKYYK